MYFQLFYINLKVYPVSNSFNNNCRELVSFDKNLAGVASVRAEYNDEGFFWLSLSASRSYLCNLISKTTITHPLKDVSKTFLEKIHSLFECASNTSKHFFMKSHNPISEENDFEKVKVVHPLNSPFSIESAGQPILKTVSTIIGNEKTPEF